MAQQRIYLVGTFDTKGVELAYLREQVHAAGVPVVTVDVSTTRTHTATAVPDIGAAEVAAAHPDGATAVFIDNRGAAVEAMAVAFSRFMAVRGDVGAIVGVGGSGGTAIITPAMQAMRIGVPKLMVSTMASGDVGAYVGQSDIAMMNPVTDIAGLNRISRLVLGNAGGSIAGAFLHQQRHTELPDARPAVGLSMFGVTTTCIRQICADLERDHDCLVFHTTGVGGASMEKLLDQGLLAGLLDITTTEVADHLLGGVLACTDDRFGAVARTGLPYVGSCGALDMVNFAARDTVPARFEGRNIYVHNAQVTLVRTTADDCRRIGAWIGERLNRVESDIRFLLPLGGVSALDAPGQPFHDPAADRALFDTIERTVRATPRRQVLRVPHHINDPEFAALAVRHFREISPPKDTRHAPS